MSKHRPGWNSVWWEVPWPTEETMEFRNSTRCVSTAMRERGSGFFTPLTIRDTCPQAASRSIESCASVGTSDPGRPLAQQLCSILYDFVWKCVYLMLTWMPAVRFLFYSTFQLKYCTFNGIFISSTRSAAHELTMRLVGFAPWQNESRNNDGLSRNESVGFL